MVQNSPSAFFAVRVMVLSISSYVRLVVVSWERCLMASFWEAFASAATRAEARSCRRPMTANATDAVMTSRLQRRNSFFLSPPAAGNLLFSIMSFSFFPVFSARIS